MNNQAQSKGICARFTPVGDISVHEIRQMYQIFQKYYHHTDLDTFLRDMSNKTGVVLVRTRRDREIVGFTTVRIMDMQSGKLRGKGLFIGDTILEKQYWGSRAMQLGLFRVMLRENRRPELRQLVWQYCEDLFPGVYDPEKEVLDFGESAQCLREEWWGRCWGTPFWASVFPCGPWLA